ncbi:glycoside hydrolase family 16 protein [Podospora didyma]|uniref:endo-1,3(4)-beta-glucanase n=1 Tax=Podospora didyma TaxID=330526 RepID=A0AAE0P821_9PEZI|nr:glycoside hydrolase family 16 protein [Podospora didyma]
MGPSKTLRLAATALVTALAVQSASSYTQVDVFDQSNFFKEFSFFTEPDPTNGFVKYVSAKIANDHGLAGYSKNSVYLGVDHANKTTSGRSSVRVTSNKAYTKGLFIADIQHMPSGRTDAGSCGLWPAFWMFGPGWPSSGEIDIIEGVNTQSSNAITLHTSSGCHMSNKGSLGSTKLVSSNCEGNAGCSQNTKATDNYGAGFNAAGGGVYAVEWADSSISVWFFSRDSSMASSLTSSDAAPDTSDFGQPLAVFGGSSCDISKHFKDNNLVFDTTFCGDWAGEVWDNDSTCSQLADSCEAYVGANPQAFANAYWLVNSIKVYQKKGSASKRVEKRFAA